MQLTSAGNFGIGDTNPSVALDVVGDINFTGQIVDVSDIRMKYDSFSRWTARCAN